MNQRLPASILLLVFMLIQIPFSAVAQSFKPVDSVLDPLTYGLGSEYREFPPLRTEKTVTFVKKNGEFVTVGALADVFTHDENGVLVPIDETGRVTKEGIVFDRLAGDASVVFSRFHPSYTFSKGGHFFTLTYRGDAVAHLETPNTVAYALTPNITVRFTVHGSSVMKNIFVTGPVDPADLRFSVTQDSGLRQRLIRNEIVLSDERGTDIFLSDAPNLQETHGRILDHPISLRPLGDGMYEYLYDPEGLPGMYVIDPNTRFKDPRSVSGGWTNASNIIGSDDVYATRTLASNLLAASLVPLFTFFIPDSSATISGMTVKVERKTDAVFPENVKDSVMTLTINGNTSENKAVLTDWPTGGDETKEYGGPSDLWGLTGLTSATMKAVTATLTAICTSADCLFFLSDALTGTAYVDSMTLQVTGTFSAGYLAANSSNVWFCPKGDFEFPFCWCGCVGKQNGITLSGGADAIVDANNESIDLTQISSQTGVHVARIKKGSIPIAEYVLDFRLVCGGYAGNVFANNPTNFNANTSGQTAYAHPTGGYRTVNNSSGYVLFVPKSVSHDSVRVCSGATTLGCTASNSWSFVANDQGTITSTNGGFDTTGIAVSVSDGYWNIDNLKGTGGEGENSGAGGGNSVPEFSVIGLLALLAGCAYFMRHKILNKEKP